jgi:hypothetical protein
MSEEFDDDAQEIPAAVVPKNYLINPKLLVVLVVLVALITTHSLQCLSFRPSDTFVAAGHVLCILHLGQEEA